MDGITMNNSNRLFHWSKSFNLDPINQDKNNTASLPTNMESSALLISHKSMWGEVRWEKWEEILILTDNTTILSLKIRIIRKISRDILIKINLFC